MRTNAIIRIVLFCIAIVVLLSILGVGIAANMFAIDLDFFGADPDVTVSSEGSADGSQIRDISIEWAAGSITIVPGDGDDICFAESGAANEQEIMNWKVSGDELKIQFQKPAVSFGIGFTSTGSKDLVITVPRDWTCDTLSIDAAAAQIDVRQLTIREVDFDGASGDCFFTDCAIDSIDMDTASGNVTLSGTMNEMEFDGASSDCTLVLSNCPHRIEMDMASGDLDLTLPDDCGFTARLEALSGDLETDFEVTRSGGGFVSGDGACRIDVSAMSGNVCIRKCSSSEHCDH